MCETCAHYEAECERLRERCEALHIELRSRAIYHGESDYCDECRETWPDGRPESHAPGCLCAPEAGPSLDAPQMPPEILRPYLFPEPAPPLQPASNPLRPAPGEEREKPNGN